MRPQKPVEVKEGTTTVVKDRLMWPCMNRSMMIARKPIILWSPEAFQAFKTTNQRLVDASLLQYSQQNAPLVELDVDAVLYQKIEQI